MSGNITEIMNKNGIFEGKNKKIRKKIKLIFDTNFLFVPFKFGIDIFDEIKQLMPLPYELYIMSGTIREIERIANNKEKKGKERKEAKMVLKMIERFDFKIIDGKDYVDEAILEEVKKNPQDFVVATGDKELRKKLLEEKILGVIYVRNRSYLEFFSPIIGLLHKTIK